MTVFTPGAIPCAAWGCAVLCCAMPCCGVVWCGVLWWGGVGWGGVGWGADGAHGLVKGYTLHSSDEVRVCVGGGGGAIL